MRRHRPRRCRRHYEKNLRLRKSGNETRKRSVSALVKKMKLNSMNICVLMFYDSGIASFADFTFKINKQYCAKYGFDIIKSNTTKYNDRTPHWERLPLLLAHIRNYDYVMWVDADAFFHHDARSIAHIIARYSNYDMIFSKDTCTNTFTGGYDINSGVFIAKNTPKSIQVLEQWAYNPAVFQFAKSRPIWTNLDQKTVSSIERNWKYSSILSSCRNTNCIQECNLFEIPQEIFFDPTIDNEQLIIILFFRPNNFDFLKYLAKETVRGSANQILPLKTQTSLGERENHDVKRRDCGFEICQRQHR